MEYVLTETDRNFGNRLAIEETNEKISSSLSSEFEENDILEIFFLFWKMNFFTEFFGKYEHLVNDLE